MKGDEVYLRHIADAIAKIQSYTSVGREVFLSTTHWQDAVIRQLAEALQFRSTREREHACAAPVMVTRTATRSTSSTPDRGRSA